MRNVARQDTGMARGTWWKDGPPGPVQQLPRGQVVCADALDFLCHLRDACALVVFIDPPFNLGKAYGDDGEGDRRRAHEYLAYMTKVIERACVVLREGGALYFYHIPRWAIAFANILGRSLDFQHWISISMKNGFVRPKHLYPAHYALLHFSKGKPSIFRRPKIPTQRCRHCQGYIRDYGGYEKYVRRGINLSDVWDDISPVRHAKYKHRTPNELPLEIPRRAVSISGWPNGLFVDPFAGSGASLVAAQERGMRFVACDRKEEYCNLMARRLRTPQDMEQ